MSDDRKLQTPVQIGYIRGLESALREVMKLGLQDRRPAEVITALLEQTGPVIAREPDVPYEEGLNATDLAMDRRL